MIGLQMLRAYPLPDGRGSAEPPCASMWVEENK
jgi:hypothetical protein